MAIIKCKMCGGDIELTADKTFGTCDYCGSVMTLPKVDDDQRAALFNRGNHFRRIGEFDKALAVYEQIIRDQDADAEAHWCCALCRFGIEYVEDPVTYEYLPTCHRASFDSFLEDVDYKSALEYSDGITRRQYMKDGAKIAEVQRGILATSQNAEPYDVFICYKESDESGNRTRDSLIAQDIYYQLTDQGRKVFFARITLEDVAGTQYEPYIFAALNSAKVMIVVGTRPEHLNAVWVKNEWSRFLAMMKKDRHKLLLPCYRDMDPYDMPEQLGVLQSYDMGKIGFIQDLTRGVAKVLDAEKKPAMVKETVVVQQNAPLANNTAPLLKRAFLFLEDQDWVSANEYCEKVLDMDPECALAYLGKLMAELKVSKQHNLKDQAEPFVNYNNYQKAIRFADEELKNILTGYIAHIMARNENARKDSVLSDARARMELQTTLGYADAIKLLESIPGWKDADKMILDCEQRIKEIQSREAAEQQERQRQRELARAEAAARSKRSKKITAIVAAIVCVIIVFSVIMNIMTTTAPVTNNPDETQPAALAATEPDYEAIINGYISQDTHEQGDTSTADKYITLGAYEQDNNTANGKEPIEWLVLAERDGKVLVVSKYALDYKNFGGSTWDTCSLRGWLNDDFLNEAFTDKEKAKIPTVTVEAHAVTYYSPGGSERNETRDPGNDTQDRIFLLSAAELHECFDSTLDRACQASEYAKAKGTYVSNHNGNCWWWLRSSVAHGSASIAYDHGGYETWGNDHIGRGVRPAMWVDLAD